MLDTLPKGKKKSYKGQKKILKTTLEDIKIPRSTRNKEKDREKILRLMQILKKSMRKSSERIEEVDKEIDELVLQDPRVGLLHLSGGAGEILATRIEIPTYPVIVLVVVYSEIFLPAKPIKPYLVPIPSFNYFETPVRKLP